MTINQNELKNLIETELLGLTDDRVTTQIREFLVEPEPVMRPWDYGKDDDEYLCWTVLTHKQSDTNIAYCEHGFGPRSPWGLVGIPVGDEVPSMGMDCSWFTTFLEAYFDSQVVTHLPIWRVFVSGDQGSRLPMTPEASWSETWRLVMEYRSRDTTNRYDCGTSIYYPRE